MMSKIEKLLSKILLLGIMISSIFMFSGIFLSFLNHTYSSTLLNIGIFILIITPIIRIFSILTASILEKNSLYTAISLIVLVILLISFVIGIS